MTKGVGAGKSVFFAAMAAAHTNAQAKVAKVRMSALDRALDKIATSSQMKPEGLCGKHARIYLFRSICN